MNFFVNTVLHTYTIKTFLKSLSIFSKGISFEKIDKNFLYENKHAFGKFEERIT